MRPPVDRPLVGLLATVSALVVLAAQIGLSAVPLAHPEGDPTADGVVRARELTGQQERGFRLEVGLALLLLGAVPTGAAALAASRADGTGRALSATAGVIWAACVAAWLVSAGLAYAGDGPRDSNDWPHAPLVERSY